MTTPKDQIVPGAMLRVVNRNNGSVNDHLVLMQSHGAGLASSPAKDGLVLQVLSKPRIINGIKCVEIEYTKVVSETRAHIQKAWAYYTHIRFCTELI